MITIPTEVKILEETDNLIKVQFKGETHTLFNALKEIAYTINGVKKAAYFIEHPLKDNNYFIIETDGSIKARDALIQALKKLKEELLNFKDWYYSNL
ncbi:NEQ182 [Nanoarchaeum equitans Kin4-M]|uniref:DNA-directed RNA polymerase subunit Rpo11 n=1 Tax=Nanoarchaeum equitans (strain Kin4-M) TaxID=228908 RepID=RPO11_NANEQ|nr:RecName: Full=DNA-directed RNA polymerase subunit Rpo11; AltName: Full=DNA-directed RNA polymerase subunit L [Nanoarchaeum equitans Kin4-M]AAR39035.1 NEQ182 [Nanoarchaeum equitans Kin4-M]